MWWSEPTTLNFNKHCRWCSWALDHLEKSWVLLKLGKNSPVYFWKARLPPTSTCSGACVHFGYNDLPPTHWTSPMLLSLLSFLKFFPLAEIPSSLYLLTEVIFIFQDPFHISPPLGSLPQFTQSKSLSQPCIPITHRTYDSIYCSASSIDIEFFTYYVSAYLAIWAGIGKLWSAGQI